MAKRTCCIPSEPPAPQPQPGCIPTYLPVPGPPGPVGRMGPVGLRGPQGIQGPAGAGVVLDLNNQYMHVASTLGLIDQQSTGLFLIDTPLANSLLYAVVNGVSYPIGNGTLTQPFYFSAGNPLIPKLFSQLVAGDTLFFNGVIMDFVLEPSDNISVHYLITYP